MIVLCPTCKGKKFVEIFHNEFFSVGNYIPRMITEDCKTCDSSGWIEERKERDEANTS
jgi:hypothetical protein